MRVFRRSLVGLFLLCVTLGLLTLGGYSIYAAMSDKWSETTDNRPARERSYSVNVAQLEPMTVRPVLSAFGEVRSRRTLDLRAPISGRIIELADGFEDGAPVRDGQLLARIDPSDAKNDVDNAQADLVEARADLQNAQTGLTLARDELAAGERQANIRETAVVRQQDLLGRRVGTEAALEEAQLAVSLANQTVLSRRQAVAQAQADIVAAQNLIARRDIALQKAERDLVNTQIIAPFDGRLADVTATVGGVLGPNEKLAEIIDLTRLEVAFRVSTAQYARLLDKQGALIESAADVTLDGRTFQARITRESATVAQGSAGRLLFATFVEMPTLRPGDFVTVQIKEPPLENVVQVPATAVNAAGEVLVIGDDDRLETAQADLLRRQGDDVILRIRGDLSGRAIVTEQTPLLGTGIKIKPIRPGGAAPEADATVELDDDRRARLIAFVEANTRMPEPVKARTLESLNKPKVPVDVVERLEQRMGS